MIEDLKTGRLLSSEIVLVSLDDLESLGPGWNFDWVLQASRSETYKLVASELPDDILGLMSIERREGYIEVKLLENSPSNVGKGKSIKGIAGSLLAFAARLSFDSGDDGVLTLISKSKLIEHYSKTYGFMRQGKGQKMILDTRASIELIATYGGGD
jgi:hypothetical protein